MKEYSCTRKPVTIRAETFTFEFPNNQINEISNKLLKEKAVYFHGYILPIVSSIHKYTDEYIHVHKTKKFEYFITKKIQF